MPRLFKLGCAEEHPILLTDFSMTLGRGEQADVLLNDPFVSRRHCEVIKSDDAVVVRDLGAKHGTFVNGVRVSVSLLDDGDVLTLGLTNFAFSFSASRAASA